MTTAQAFYTRWAWLYDIISAKTPGVGLIRRAAIDHLGVAPGDTVVEMGCGTGANLPYLREQVGTDGTVVGIDFSPGVLALAADRIDRHGWENVHLIRADATQPPLSPVEDGSQVDVIFSSFVSGMVDDPASMVDRWAAIVGEGGTVGLLDLARSSSIGGTFINPLFSAVVRATSPPAAARDSAAIDRLDQRVAAAHARLHTKTQTPRYKTRACGFIRISSVTIEE